MHYIPYILAGFTLFYWVTGLVSFELETGTFRELFRLSLRAIQRLSLYTLRRCERLIESLS